MVEYVSTRLKNRGKITVSLHAHNDRGTAVAATELCLLAGADRVEGTLFGNGERTGNVDLITLAMNLYSQGIDPQLDFSDINEAVALYEEVTQLPVHPRHPYAGELVFTAFSGTHQDAIRKGMALQKDGGEWRIPYLPIDPKDVGRDYAEIIRVTSLSGGSGAAYILETNFGIHLPKSMQRDFGPVFAEVSNKKASELSSEEIFELFNATYVNVETPYKFVSKQDFVQENEDCSFACKMTHGGEEKLIRGHGHGVIDAFCHALEDAYGLTFAIAHYSQHSLDIGEGAKARAITYVGITPSGANGKTAFGVGVSRSTTNSALKAVVSALNNLQRA